MKQVFFSRSVVLFFALISLMKPTFAAAHTESDVQAFVRDWFHLFDTNAPVGNFLERLSDQDGDVEFQFPEQTLRSKADFTTWYAGILQTYKTAAHDVKDVQISQVGADWQVQVRVQWNAETYDAKSAELYSQQTWLVRDTSDGLKISRYIVTPIKVEKITSSVSLEVFNQDYSQGTGSTGLTCTCHGGPGNYPYACAPVRKTCYGGPGNYPYDCSVCR